MPRRKEYVRRPYAPDYVSVNTLAYRLDCSPSTIDAYVKAGLLPRPILIGSMVRWRFDDVAKFLEDGLTEVDDPYVKGLKNGAQK